MKRESLHSPGGGWVAWLACTLLSFGFVLAGDSYPALRFREQILHGLRAPLRAVSWIPQRFDLAAENRRLRHRTVELFIENTQLRELALEGIRLEGLLNLKPLAKLHSHPARVIARGSSLGPQSVVLDCGTRDSVQAGDALLTTYGLAGAVTHCGGKTCQAFLLSHRDFRIRAMVQRTREEGILAGVGMELLQLQEIPLSSELAVDDLVVSSGKGSRFPGGLPIAVVTKVEQGSGLFLKVQLRPLARLSRLEELFVIRRIETPIDNSAGKVP